MLSNSIDITPGPPASVTITAEPSSTAVSGASFDRQPEVAVRDPRVQGIVAIGPPRRQAELATDPEFRTYVWNRFGRTYRKVYGRDVPTWYSKAEYLAFWRSWDMEQYVPYFSRQGHKTLLLMHGARERLSDRNYLRRYHKRCAEPARYVTIPQSDHYGNTMDFGFRGFKLYDARVVGAMVNEIDD